MGKGSKGVPERWEDYTNMGHQIPGTRFIAFKVPLKEALLNNLSPSADHFDTRMVTDHCSALGLVVDLTNTNRYYDPEEFLTLSIQYEKLNTEGHAIPNNEVVKKFFKIVEDFLEENVKNDKLIGVHCTHGVNRTGYLICRYMIQQLGVPPDQAITDFNSARGHEQERMNYLQDLKKASWLTQPVLSSPVSPSNEGYKLRRSGDGEDTPPYMPHRTRRRRSASMWVSPGSDQNESRTLSSGNERRRSRSFSKSPKYGWSPYGPQGPPEWRSVQPGPYSSPPERSRGRKRRSSCVEENQESTDRSPKSPKFGKEYYERYFKGQVLHQYDVDFYSRNGGGVGPHRPPPRCLPPVQGDGKRPRQYRGPRPYRSPPRQEEPVSYSLKTTRQRSVRSPQETETRNLDVEGPVRKPLSPGTNSDTFSPEDEFGRRRSRRFQPY